LYAQQSIALQALQQQQTLVRNDQQAVQSAISNVKSAISAVQANGTRSQGMQASNVQNSQASQAQAYAQADQLRAEIARGSALRTVMPSAVLLPSLMPLFAGVAAFASSGARSGSLADGSARMRTS